MVEKEIIAENWSIPLTERDVTLEEAASSMNKWKLTQSEVPLIIQLVENPKYRLKWLFPGSVTLRVHDYAHISFDGAYEDMSSRVYISITDCNNIKVV